MHRVVDGLRWASPIWFSRGFVILSRAKALQQMRTSGRYRYGLNSWIHPGGVQNGSTFNQGAQNGVCNVSWL